MQSVPAILTSISSEDRKCVGGTKRIPVVASKTNLGPIPVDTNAPSGKSTPTCKLRLEFQSLS